VQNAWEVLSDPQERSWYNSHREQILRSDSHEAGASCDGAGAECPYPEYDFERFRGRSAFAGFGTDPKGFYSVFGGLFGNLAEEEMQAYRRQKPINKELKEPDIVGAFGGKGAAGSDVKAFYTCWCNFQSIKDFAWLDEYNPSSAPGRRIRRIMESENERRRKAGKRDFVAEVRATAGTVRVQDPRMEEFAVRVWLPASLPAVSFQACPLQSRALGRRQQQALSVAAPHACYALSRTQQASHL
jgi:DnaJ homolog subfamily A member 5